MTNRRLATAGLRGVVLAALLVAMWSLWMRPAPVHGADDAVKLRVEITDAGFNGKAGDLNLEVDEGKLVELTFVWAHKAYTAEEHIMVLEGYKLEWDKITAQHKEATASFVATKSGSFNFMCDLQCELHPQLQRGFLKVRPAGAGGSSGGAAALTPTTLTVTSSSKTAGDSLVNLMAVLRDAKGAPVSKATVRFVEDADFIGVKAPMDLGTAKTDDHGVAFLDYQPTLDLPSHKITAQFEGMGVYDQSKQSVDLAQIGAPALGYDPQPIGLDTLRQWAPLGLTLVILAVWSTFAYVMVQVVGVARVASIRARVAITPQ